jgi:nitronate monooxygenase
MHSAATSRLLTLLGIDHPVIQAPMAGSSTPEMAIAVSEVGGLGSLPSALYSESDLRMALEKIRAATHRPINLNFFSHTNPPDDPARQSAWAKRLADYYVENGLDPNMTLPTTGRAPFNDALATVVEDCRPEIVSFHFGLGRPREGDRRQGDLVCHQRRRGALACRARCRCRDRHGRRSRWSSRPFSKY